MELVLRDSDVVISCTGNQAINSDNIHQLKDGSIISSSTSADDEFGLSSVLLEAQSRKVSDNLTKYSLGGKSFYLMNEGNAVNFLHNAVVGDFIFLVQSEILEATKELFYRRQKQEAGITSLRDDVHEHIAIRFIDALNKKFG